MENNNVVKCNKQLSSAAEALDRNHNILMSDFLEVLHHSSCCASLVLLLVSEAPCLYSFLTMRAAVGERVT